MTQMVKLTYDEGSGRPYCILIEKKSEFEEKEELIQALLKTLGAKSRVCVIETDDVNNESWKTISSQLYSEVEKKIRAGSYIAIGDTTALLQSIYLIQPKLIRSSVLVNPHTQPHPTPWKRMINNLEEWLPLGLPLRMSGNTFDSRSELHRIRAPSLIVTLPGASNFEVIQAKATALKMPTAWYTHVEDINSLAEIILQFQDVPAKCPQKSKQQQSSIN